MNRHNNILHSLPLIGALAVLVSFAGCISNEEIKNPDLESVQVTEFRLEDNDNPLLKDTFFSIDHRKGLIYNAKLLPKAFDMDSVKVGLAHYVNTEIKFVIAGKEETIGSNDSISFKGWKEGITLQLTNADKQMHKEYRLEIRCYDYDPQSYTWEVLAGSEIPDLTNSKRVLFRYTNERVYLFAAFKDETSAIYVVSKDNLSSWQKVAVNTPLGLIKDVTISERGRAYLINEDGQLFESDGDLTNWAVANAEHFFHSILGCFITPGSTSETVALIVKGATPSEEYFYALGNSTTALGEKVPDDFPRESISSLAMTVSHHPMLLLTGSLSATPSEEERSGVWTTTTGLDWLLLPAKEENKLPASKDSKLLMYDASLGELYCIIPANLVAKEPSMRIFISSDRGATWQEGNASLMLPPSSSFGIRGGDLGGYIEENQRMILFGGVLSDATFPRNIWSGYPRIKTGK